MRDIELEDEARLPGAVIGALLAMANVIVIAVAMDNMCLLPQRSCIDRELVNVVVGVTFVPSVIVGALLGAAVGVRPESPRWRRRAIVIGPALLYLYVLGSLAGMQVVVPYAAIPTLAACLILERATRPRARVPRAIAVTK